jgi:hypothetical protein
MSSAADAPQEIVVDGPLADELERRGVHVHAGDRVQLQLVPEPERSEEQTAAWEAFVGSFTTGDPDFAERSEEILRAEFGR